MLEDGLFRERMESEFRCPWCRTSAQVCFGATFQVVQARWVQHCSVFPGDKAEYGIRLFALDPHVRARTSNESGLGLGISGFDLPTVADGEACERCYQLTTRRTQCCDEPVCFACWELEWNFRSHINGTRSPCIACGRHICYDGAVPEEKSSDEEDEQEAEVDEVRSHIGAAVAGDVTESDDPARVADEQQYIIRCLHLQIAAKDDQRVVLERQVHRMCDEMQCLQQQLLEARDEVRELKRRRIND